MLEHLFGALADPLFGEVFLARGQEPQVTERVRNARGAVAIELVLRLGQRCGASIEGSLVLRVHVFYIQVQTDTGVFTRMRRATSIKGSGGPVRGGSARFQ